MARQHSEDSVLESWTQCLQGVALQWYSCVLSDDDRIMLEGAPLQDVVYRLIDRFKDPFAKANGYLRNARFTMADVAAGQDIMVFINTVVSKSQMCGMSAPGQIQVAYEAFDSYIQLCVPKPSISTTMDDFVKSVLQHQSVIENMSHTLRQDQRWKRDYVRTTGGPRPGQNRNGYAQRTNYTSQALEGPSESKPAPPGQYQSNPRQGHNGQNGQKYNYNNNRPRYSNQQGPNPADDKPTNNYPAKGQNSNPFFKPWTKPGNQLPQKAYNVIDITDEVEPDDVASVSSATVDDEQVDPDEPDDDNAMLAAGDGSHDDVVFLATTQEQTGPRRHICRRCKRTFNSGNKLHDHLVSVHAVERGVPKNY
ncbi:hypothetical protein F503_05885 [Ophiostoma piceae UAMH 11346]|uniref:C2H2-type domain-containing protein n=1 Tax=Ophiostoma piceae (strain UAMH 11346) TaxID=1262450 RepID=S3DB73_OPHP1|nr:hypothetical protein F503_05885 [Ophiostoma piceae UAMH 11346]